MREKIRVRETEDVKSLSSSGQRARSLLLLLKDDAQNRESRRKATGGVGFALRKAQREEKSNAVHNSGKYKGSRNGQVAKFCLLPSGQRKKKRKKSLDNGALSCLSVSFLFVVVPVGVFVFKLSAIIHSCLFHLAFSTTFYSVVK